MKRDYVQLAHTYEDKKHSPAGWFVSEKLDGMRAWWDGGRSRGIACSEIPYANTEKDGRYIEAPVATGLWSRHGKVIKAPDWFLDQLPNYCLDGELWLRRNSWQEMSSIVKDLTPGSGWTDVKYMILDAPTPALLFMDGEVRILGYTKVLRGCYKWWYNNQISELKVTNFESTYNHLVKNITQTHNLRIHEQTLLEFNTALAKEQLNALLDRITDEGGEGLILRKSSALWEPKRSHNILKVKKWKDAEAIVTGYTTGRETDKGSKLLGKMGALITNFGGKRLELSGFTDEEREFSTDACKLWAEDNPEKEVPNWIKNDKFPRGSIVTFKYRELTDGGVPKEARYWRKLA